MLWIHSEQGNLHSNDYIANILEPGAIPFEIATIGQEFLYQDDNGHPQTVRIVQDYHDRHLEYTHMELPCTYNPDLSPIQHMWDILDRAVSLQSQPPKKRYC